MNYFHAHHFRSRAVVEFGTPIGITSELVEKYRMGGAEKRDACSKLLEIIYNGLKSVTVNTPDYDTLMVNKLNHLPFRPVFLNSIFNYIFLFQFQRLFKQLVDYTDLRNPS